MRHQSYGEGLAFDIMKGAFSKPHSKNDFDRNEPWIMTILGAVFIICAIASGYATFAGYRRFLEEVGDIGVLVNGTSVILTIAVTAILAVGWSVICRWGPEARTSLLKGLMVLLGAGLFAITLCVSSLPNAITLGGPAAKVAAWKETLAGSWPIVNAYGDRALGVASLRASWLAEQERSCKLADVEVDRGVVSSSGGGVGPVAAALIGACAQTRSFIASADTAIAETKGAVIDARAALKVMQQAIRDRETAVLEREDRFLEAGEALDTAMQQIRAADLSQVLEAGAEQVRQSVAELSANSSFSAKQVETVTTIKQGLGGLVAGVTAVAGSWRAQTLPAYRSVESPNYLTAILTYWHRFVPIVAAAIGIDAFQVWALFFLLVSKAGKNRNRLRGDFEGFLDTDAYVALSALAPANPKAAQRRWWPFAPRSTVTLKEKETQR